MEGPLPIVSNATASAAPPGIHDTATGGQGEIERSSLLRQVVRAQTTGEWSLVEIAASMPGLWLFPSGGVPSWSFCAGKKPVSVGVRSGSRCSQPVLVLAVFLVVPMLATVGDARFTRAACLGNDCIQRNRYGTVCYYPDPDTPINGLPKTTCSDEVLTSAMNAHLHVYARRPAIFAPWNPSGAYYGHANDSWVLLGNADYVVPSYVPSIETLVVCQTGLVKSETRAFVTTCRFTTQDNDFDLANRQDTVPARCTATHGHDERVLTDRGAAAPRALCVRRAATGVSCVPPTACASMRRPNAGSCSSSRACRPSL